MSYEQRITIAKFCGWKDIEEYHYHDADGIDGFPPNFVDVEGFGKKFFRKEIPDYFYDLNAINEAILKLPEGNMASSNPAHYPHWMFWTHLCKILGIRLFNNGTFVGSPDDLFKLTTATATQRAEALLQTIKTI
jgi:hypothetical protein